ncbi:MAG: hypothetical protein ABR536_02920 [Solirubrobacterales bacterium]
MRPLHYRFGIVLALILTSISFELGAPNGDATRLVAVALQGATLVAAALARHSAVRSIWSRWWR